MDKFWKKKTKDKKKNAKERYECFIKNVTNTGNGERENEKWEQNLTENLDTELTLFTRITFLDLFLPKIIGMYSEVVNATTPMTTQI